MFRTMVCRCHREATRLGTRGYRRRVPVRFFGPGSFFRDPLHWPERYRPPYILNPSGPFGWVEKEFEDIARRFAAPFFREPWHYGESDMKVAYDEKDFKVTLDVSEFNPEDLSLKVVDGTITITGKHEQRPDDHGTVSREFTRQVLVPEDVDLDTITCSVTPEGLMKVMGKVKVKPDVKAERVINIEREPGEGSKSE